MAKSNKSAEMPQEVKIELEEASYHIYDFLVRCKVNRNMHDIIHKKYEGSGLKTQAEWELITKLKMA